jgi:hypothetical protein
MKKILLSAFTLSAFLTVNAQSTDLFISEYVEGSGNDKAIELYNPTNAPINLSGYSLNRYSNGSSSITSTLLLSGTIAANATFVIVNGQTTIENGGTSPAVSPALQAYALSPNNGQLDGPYDAPTYFNGDDAVTLEKNGAKIDIFGKIGEDPGTAWTATFPHNNNQGTWITRDYTLVRKASVTGGVTTNPTVFDPLAQYDTLPENTWTGLGSHVFSGASGISEIDNSVSLSVFPNPSNTNFVNVSASEVIETIEMYNAMGQRVAQKEGNKTAKHTTVETGELSKGMYVVKVKFANNKATVTRLSIQ